MQSKGHPRTKSTKHSDEKDGFGNPNPSIMSCGLQSLDAKIDNLLENPVRRGLVAAWENYPWLWKKPFVNPFAPAL